MAHHHIAPEDRIPIRQKVAFAVGVNMDIFCTSLTLNVLWLPVFNIGLGMSPVVLSGILVVLRIWDAFADPIVGNLSDNARTRWGRRRPFIFAGALAVALIYPLFWHLPAGWSDTARVIALTAIGLLFFTAYTIWAMPYYGLQLELTPSYDERTRLSAWGSIFAKLGYLLMGWVFALVLYLGSLAVGDPNALEGKDGALRAALEQAGTLFHWLADPAPGESQVVVGMRVACWFIVLGMLVFGLCPALFVRERYYRSEAIRQPKTPFVTSLRESFRCRPLWLLIGMTFFLLIGRAFIDGLNQYVNFYYVCRGDLVLGATIAGWKATVVSVVGFLSIPVLTKLSERFDKRAVVLAMLAMLTCGHLSNYLLMTPEAPYRQIWAGLFEAIAVPAIWMFMPAMKADVADWDEYHTSRRREGSLNSFYSWFVKAALTVSLIFSGVALAWSGFDAKLPEQSHAVVSRMFHLYLGLPIAFWVTAIVFAWFYPLSRKAALDIRTALEDRRGKI